MTRTRIKKGERAGKGDNKEHLEMKQETREEEMGVRELRIIRVIVIENGNRGRRENKKPE